MAPEAEWSLVKIREGLRLVEKSLQMNKEAPEAIAVHGALLLLQVRTEAEPEARKRYAEAARNALEKAIAMNSFLRKDYEPLLKETKGI